MKERPKPSDRSGRTGVVGTQNANPQGSLERVVRRRLIVSSPEIVPKEIAMCPECGGRLWWQVETTDGVRDMSLDCENEPDIDENEEMYHRWWQGEWQPVIDRVKRWVVGAAASPYFGRMALDSEHGTGPPPPECPLRKSPNK